MPEYTIGSTEFVSLTDPDTTRQSQAQNVIDYSAVYAAKFVLVIDTTQDRVLSLIILPPLSSHLRIILMLERVGHGKFFGALKLKKIGKDSRTAMWGSKICLEHYGYDTPQGVDAQELDRILELVKSKAVECLEGVIRGEEPS